MNARGVHNNELVVIFVQDTHDAVSGGLGLGRNDGYFLAKQGIE